MSKTRWGIQTSKINDDLFITLGWVGGEWPMYYIYKYCKPV